jgi:hypothetical protein
MQISEVMIDSNRYVSKHTPIPEGSKSKQQENSHMVGIKQNNYS